MIKKGIILAGGMGTRMSPLTKAVNKQLLPIYDKPLIFYPLSILMLSKIKDVLIIVNKGQLQQYKKLIPNGKKLGMKITYIEQSKPRGLPDAFKLGEKFIGKDNVAMILGDNFFYGQNLTSKLLECAEIKDGARIILHTVKNPELFGVAKVDKDNKITTLKEKPKKYLSNQAITGLYFFDNKVIEFAKNVKPSKRGELEITDVIKQYFEKGELFAEDFGRGFAWLDTGTHKSLMAAGQFVQVIEERQGLKIACLEELAYRNGWISKEKLMEIAVSLGNTPYGNYVKLIAEQ